LSKSVSQLSKNAPSASDNVDTGSLDQWLGGLTFEQAYQQYEEQGYILFKDVMDADGVQQVRDALDPFLTNTGRNDFEGFKTNRVYSLLAKAPAVFSKMVTHPLALAFAERDLGESCLLSALLAINLHPGETVQGWHCDDSQVSIPRPRKAFGVSAFWAIDDTTELNGATEFIADSHNWTEDKSIALAEVEDLMDPRERDPNHDPQPRSDTFKIPMTNGSLLLVKSSLYHRGGANLSDASRLIVTPQYCTGWARQLENMALAIPPDIVRTLPKRVRELIGYSIHEAFMGYVDGVHPEKSL
jgi:ectoine hydroxylase-related dioxygenase (phytanoyl-CoA dioxygenase family)